MTARSNRPDPARRRAKALKRQAEAERAMRGWKAYSAIAVLGLLGALLLWLGQAIVVRAERSGDGRIDVSVQRRFLGLVPSSTERLHDLVKADVYVVWSRGGTGRQIRGSTMALDLTGRDGSLVRRTRFGPSAGTQPLEMSEQIGQFMATPTAASLSTWWMPWLVNLAALPFVLIFVAIVGEVGLRRLGVLKPAAAAEHRS
jgi:hypothetical protein